MAVAIQTRPWTIEDLDRLPDDGNKYEVVRGELFVTPTPSPPHENGLAELNALLAVFVAEHRLGLIYRPRAVIQFEGSQVEPDLMVRQRIPSGVEWDKAPTPILVVELTSRATARRDRNQKRQLYLDAGVAEYWIVHREQRNVTVVRPGHRYLVCSDFLEWKPKGTGATLRIELAGVFG